MVLVSRRTSSILLGCLGLFLLGTVGVLSIVRAYFHVDEIAFIRNLELGTLPEITRGVRPSALTIDPDARLNTSDIPAEQIPRIIHQTWKTDNLPSRWAKTREACAAMMPDYKYMLWTDASSRQLIETDYEWFLPVFDAYPYNIQRADAIRYFVLHKYGGIYMDLDIGCKRRLDSLLRFDAILPKTIPVGVSNDLIFAAKQHPFMQQLIENLTRFNHHFLTPYATVMFSTGPMFVSAVYRMYADAHALVTPSTPDKPTQGFKGIRVLPKSLYGKNAKPNEAPDAFFEHMYGSSWHEGDAGFLIFLRNYGRLLMAIGLAIVLVGLRRFWVGPIFNLCRWAWGQLSRYTSYAPEWVQPYLFQRSVPGPEWVRLTSQDDGCFHDTTPKPVPVFSADEPIGVDANVTSNQMHIFNQLNSQPLFAEPKPHVPGEGSSRGSFEYSALGSYSKQEDRGTSPAHLPAYYVDGSSKYAMDDANLHAQDSTAKTGSMRTRRSLNLNRLRPSWRSLSVAPLKALVSKPLRRNSASHTEEAGDSDRYSFDHSDSLSRTISSQSDEYRREFASLVQGNSNDPYSFESPTLEAVGSPPPTVLISQEQEPPALYRSAVTRRQPVSDLSRVLTPAVPPLPPSDYLARNHD
ncbi:hypothetical protein MYAM1_000260 [Malassezia yamatoensis]|uniref:Mannosyl phosphorylinositol ceramide synthase SUR1 n=1 Tax=Malassezia yamatoensis TaxID=253288 RepID=A0AAJ5YP68_9BASI|nr:hypothetical protein MYAM1_000260 [Malassezia yamatoensis]